MTDINYNRHCECARPAPSGTRYGGGEMCRLCNGLIVERSSHWFRKQESERERDEREGGRVA